MKQNQRRVGTEHKIEIESWNNSSFEFGTVQEFFFLKKGEKLEEKN
mgnify:CR=1 FL=1